MIKEGKLLPDTTSVEEWDLSDVEECEQNFVRYSKGFLACDVRSFFSGIAADWIPLFASSEIDFTLVKVTQALDFPDDLTRIVACEFNGEIGVIGMDEPTCQALGSVAVAGEVDDLSETIIEYVERRLLASLSRHWQGRGDLRCNYLPSADLESVEVIGAVSVYALLNGKPLAIWFGLGARVTDLLDEAWKDVLEKTPRPVETGRNKVFVEAQIAEFVVPSSFVTDFLRDGQIIDLQLPRDNRVIVVKDGQPWAQGELYRLNGRFAVRVNELGFPAQEVPNGFTRISATICSVDLSPRGMSENAQKGAVILTGTAESDLITLAIGGENVAYARLGVIGDRFVATVLERS